ncbi:vWA domain-containing protein [Laspinema palackyanum]|uniref:vWA domain-containing protein n=1 Tax=Laspinema palackyanum TaxID=3231601 RepID=UPI00345D3CAD|nr:VWA domain-containing protein [Laspinema sp. D2c]
MIRSRRQIWQYPLFQIPLIFMIGCAIVAALSWLLGFGRPPVAVAIAIDFSDSTSGIVRQQEIQAVESYINQNQSLKKPNAIQVFGFASDIRALTTDFTPDNDQLETQFNSAIYQPTLEQELGGGTNLNLAIQQTTNALSTIENRCRELLLVTDGIAPINDTVIQTAQSENVKINVVIVGGSNSEELQQATRLTDGLYLSAEASNLDLLFTETFFRDFNSNLRWVMFWLSGAFIFLMWTLTLPLDRWLFQGIMGLDMTLAGQMALGNALFWTIVTLIAIWKGFGIPFGNPC